MALGARVRKMFGPLEPTITDLYRSFFISIPDLASRLQQLCTPARVLEVGCGEGALVTEMARLWPSARIDAIDVTPRLGRLYCGDPSRVNFQQVTVQDYAKANPAAVDLVVICDVLHHIPWGQHPEILVAAARTLRPGGIFVIKEWLNDGYPPFWLGYFGDRYISGTRIRFGTRTEWVQKFEEVFGPAKLRQEFSVAPWSCNRAFILQPEYPSN